MRIVVPSETAPDERRVALVPDAVGKLTKLGAEVAVQAGAGKHAYHPDADYTAAGAQVVADRGALAGSGDVLLSVSAPAPDLLGLLREGTATLSFLQPGTHLDTVRAAVDRKVTTFSLDLLPRISRAQSMDALSSQAIVSGYHAMVLAAERAPRFFPLFMTAAGTVAPAKVLVMGAGVAGLQAIATARRLGAVVEAYDVRAAAAEEVRSLGATFVELELETQEGAGGYAREQSEDFLRRQRELIGERVAASDVVVTTAAIPGRTAPVLVTDDMVRRMRPGSVVVDLAAETGGNVEPSRPGEEIRVGDVLVIGARNMPSAMPVHASSLYARNLVNLVTLMVHDGAFTPDFDDEIVSGCCVTHAGEVRHAPTRELLEGGTR